MVTIALSCTVFELFDAELYRDLEIRVRGHSKTLKIIQIGTIRKLGCGFLFALHSKYGRIFKGL